MENVSNSYFWGLWETHIIEEHVLSQYTSQVPVMGTCHEIPHKYSQIALKYQQKIVSGAKIYANKTFNYCILVYFLIIGYDTNWYMHCRFT